MNMVLLPIGGEQLRVEAGETGSEHEGLPRGMDMGLLHIGSELLRVEAGETGSEHVGLPRGRGRPPCVELALQKQGCELGLSQQKHGVARERPEAAHPVRGRGASKEGEESSGRWTRVCETRGNQSMIGLSAELCKYL